MKVFETLRTAFRVIIAKATENRLFVLGLIFVGVLLIWAILSLIFNFQQRFRKASLKVIAFLRVNTLSQDNYREFTKLWTNFPLSMKRAWKRYETKRTGIPSDYLNQAESFDSYYNGGIFKQNRSIMKLVIMFVTIAMTIVSIAIIGNENYLSSNVSYITTTMLADALIIPIVTYVTSMVIYYGYTAIRHFDYRTTIDVFYDLVDVLDEKVNLVEVFGGDTNAIGLLSEVFENETVTELRNNAKKQQRIQPFEVKESDRNKLSPAKVGILGQENKGGNINNILATEENEIKPIDNKNVDKKLNISENKFTVMNEKQFVAMVENVDVLIEKAKLEKNESKKSKIEKEINLKIKALTEYKQKVKELKKAGKKNEEKN